MFNFISEENSTLYDFENDFTEQPEFFKFNDTQDVCIIASTLDTLLINLESKDEIDLDNIFMTRDVKTVLYDDHYFYVLANILNGFKGNYLLKIPEDIKSQNSKDLA